MGEIAIATTQAPASRRRADQLPAAVYLGRLSPGSRRTMQQSLNVMAGLLTGGRHDAMTCPWYELDYQHTQLLRSTLASSGYKPATCNKMLSALRGVLRECWRLGLMSAEQKERAVDLTSVKGKPQLTGRALAGDELLKLFATCAGDGVADRRDAALIGILYTAGLRRSEAVALDLSDFTAADDSILVRNGKGSKSRLCYLAEDMQDRLERWLELRGPAPGPLFFRIWRGDHLSENRLSDQAVRDILRRRCLEAGIPVIAPHSMRRTFVSTLLARGVDLHTVAEMAGHSNVQTTARYDRRGDERKKKAVDVLKLDRAE